MPNWCSTIYKCVGKKKDIKSLYNTLNKLEKMKSPNIENDFETLWLGSVVDELGGNWEEISCRGKIYSYDISSDGKILSISQETAWSEQEGFRKFLEEKYPGMKIYYCEEESGEDIYYTNDDTGKYFPDKYLLDFGNEDTNEYGYEYYTTIDQVIKDIETITSRIYTGPKTPEGIESFLDDYNEECDYEKFCYFHEFKYCKD